MATTTFHVNGPGDLTGIASQNPSSGLHWEKMGVSGEYVWTGSATYQSDLYQIGASIAGGKINSVTVTSQAYSADGTMVTLLKLVGDTIREGVETHVSGLTPQNVSTVYALNPMTSSLWTWSEIYSAQVGGKLKAFGGGGYTIRMYDVYVTVDYTVETVKSGADCFMGA